MKRNGKRVLFILFSILPILMVMSVYGKLPEQVPMQWNLDGISRYGAKRELFFVAGLNLLFGILMPILAKIDPKRKNYPRFQETYEWFVLLLLGFLTAMMGLALTEILHPGRIAMQKVVYGFVAVLFILLGNRMPKLKQNFFMGIKTPWTLSSDDVWNKTQRLGGKVFFFGGIVMLLLLFVTEGRVTTFVTFAVAIVICALPMGMSYFWYRQEERKGIE